MTYISERKRATPTSTTALIHPEIAEALQSQPKLVEPEVEVVQTIATPIAAPPQTKRKPKQVKVVVAPSRRNPLPWILGLGAISAITCVVAPTLIPAPVTRQSLVKPLIDQRNPTDLAFNRAVNGKQMYTKVAAIASAQPTSKKGQFSADDYLEAERSRAAIASQENLVSPTTRQSRIIQPKPVSRTTSEIGIEEPKTSPRPRIAPIRPIPGIVSPASPQRQSEPSVDPSQAQATDWMSALGRAIDRAGQVASSATVAAFRTAGKATGEFTNAASNAANNAASNASNSLSSTGQSLGSSVGKFGAPGNVGNSGAPGSPGNGNPGNPGNGNPGSGDPGDSGTPGDPASPCNQPPPPCVPCDQ